VVAACRKAHTRPLGTDVPLVAFFVISPVLFVLLQFYVLLQTLLLGRTAKAYNDELDHTVKASSDNAVFRERLANTIFAQIFAGAPRERDGWVGNILLGIAWFTLIVSPILVLLTFQFAFLPYHSQGVTWVHRGLIYAELVILFTLWPAVLDPAKEFDWHRLDLRIWRSPLWSQKQTGQLITILVLVLSTFLFSFPGEWHINLLSGRSLVSRDCTRWLPGTFGLHIDRLGQQYAERGRSIQSRKLEGLERPRFCLRDICRGRFSPNDPRPRTS
jgi:hypothetical protein